MQKKKFIIYRRDARKGSSAYSPKPHSAPHFEGHYVEGMEEWASHYCFNKRDDGKYEAELDEAFVRSQRRFEQSSYVHPFGTPCTSGIGLPRHQEHSFFFRAS